MAKPKKLPLANEANVTAAGTTATASISAVARGAKAIALLLNVTTLAATQTLDVSVEDSPDGGTSWYPLASFTQASATGTQRLRVDGPFGDQLRVKYTPSGAGPDAFSVLALIEEDNG